MISLACLLLATAASPSEPDRGAEPVALEPVVVVATRSPRPLSDVAGTVDLLDQATLAFEHVQGLHDLGRYHVGIDAEGSGTRFGTTGLAIRGIGGNRVALAVDGVRQASGFSVGSYSNAGRGPIDPALYARTEILRGPASSLYGSDAIGGVAAFFPWRPAEIAGRDGRGHRLRVGYDAATSGASTSILSAWNGPRGGLVGGVSHRRGDQLDHADGADIEDRLRQRSTSALLGGEWAPATKHLLRVTAIGYEEQRRSDLASPLGVGRFRSTTAYRGDDERDGGQLVAEWTIDAPGLGLDEAGLRLYAQRSDVAQTTHEERASRDERYRREFHYRQEAWGGELTASRRATALGAEHRIGLGLAFEQREISERRDGLQTDLAGANPTRVILGERFPVRDFPLSRGDTVSAWIQDEMQFDRLTLIPGLRYDDFAMRPRPDPLFAEDFPALEAVPIDAADVTPRLAVLYDLGRTWTLFGQYAAGFRAPPFEDVNVGLHIPFLNARAIPNPALVSESSDSFELGLRRDAGRHGFSLTLFHNAYDDFIESRVAIGVDPADGALLFQSRNVAAASIEGAELRYRFEPGGRLEQFRFRAELLAITGRDDATGAPLASVGPDEALLAVGWTPRGASGPRIELIARAAAAGERHAATPDAFVTPGYAVIDVLSSWRLGPATRLRLAAFNLADRSYWRHGATVGLAADDPVVSLLAAPGRTLSATLEVRF